MIHPVIHCVPTKELVVAVTFDDGPNPQYTPRILDILREYGAKATFFMIGEQIQNAPQVAVSVLAEGHEIGNHTFTHPYLTQIAKEQVLEEIRNTEDLIKATVGVKPSVMRPPYFDFNEQVGEWLEPFGYPAIGCVNSEAQDWEQPGVDHIVERTLESVKPGSFLLFHDGFGDRSQTVEAVRQLVATLTSQGYKFVTVSDLLSRGSN